MLILGIETSCDETAAAIVRDGRDVLANVVSSQVAKHAEYGGVIPELAAREHLKAIGPIVGETLKAADLRLADLDAIAVTHLPGLLPALLVGVNYAKGLAASLAIPVAGVNHLLAHVYGAFLEDDAILTDRASYPLLALVVSGGHSLLLLIQAEGTCRLIGTTLDDAAGEAFDKAGKVLGLPYPAGPVIDRLAAGGNPTRVRFPRGLCGGGGTPVTPENRYNFSFSGLKTSLLYEVREDPTNGDALKQMSDEHFLDVLASYQEAIVDSLARKTRWAIEDHGVKTLVLCGGVACNRRLRTVVGELASDLGTTLRIAPPRYCTDNAAMIAGLGEHLVRHGLVAAETLDAEARLGDLTCIPFAPDFGKPA